jgi:carbonic anhydrase
MRLIEAILDANHRAGGNAHTCLRHAEFADELPLVTLTCIDPRLNPLIPRALGIPEEDLIWLRNAGNIIFDTMSSMMRTLALGCVVKGGQEIAVIGHTDCLVAKSTTLQITERFRNLGIDRSRLPENLNEFFGLFASERQNVIRGANIIRESPLIGPRIPVHGLLLDIHTGRLEWIVNGYQVLEAATSRSNTSATPPESQPVQNAAAALPDFNLGDMKFPEFKIGETTVNPNQWLSQLKMPEPQTSKPEPVVASQGTVSEDELKFDRAKRYRIIGSDEKIYGPINGLKVLEWIADGRIAWDTAAQIEGTTEWRPLRAWGNLPRIPVPPTIPTMPPTAKSKRR